MSLRHPNVAKVELIAQALGPLCDQLVLGAAARWTCCSPILPLQRHGRLTRGSAR